VSAPRPRESSYTTDIGLKRARMLDRKIGVENLRVLKVGCGDGMLS
jgi:hypothetical protein